MLWREEDGQGQGWAASGIASYSSRTQRTGVRFGWFGSPKREINMD